MRLGWGSAIVLAGSVSGASLHVTEARGKGRGTLQLEGAAAGKCRPSIKPQCEGTDLNPAKAPSCTIKAPKSQQTKISGGLFLFESKFVVVFCEKQHYILRFNLDESVFPLNIIQFRGETRTEAKYMAVGRRRGGF